MSLYAVLLQFYVPHLLSRISYSQSLIFFPQFTEYKAQACHLFFKWNCFLGTAPQLTLMYYGAIAVYHGKMQWLYNDMSVVPMKNWNI